MERRQRRSFTDAYKRQAVDLVASRELTVSNSGPLISQRLAVECVSPGRFSAKVLPQHFGDEQAPLVQADLTCRAGVYAGADRAGRDSAPDFQIIFGCPNWQELRR